MPALVTLFALVSLGLTHGDVKEADYFPPHFVTSFEQAWYGGALKGAGEPSLYQIARNGSTATIYRVTVLTSFGDNYFARLEVRPDHYGLLTFTKAGLDAGPIKRRAKVILKPAGVRRFESLLAAMNFWKVPPTTNEALISDATELIYEGVSAGNYHVIQRIDWPIDGAAARPANYLLQLLNEPTERL